MNRLSFLSACAPTFLSINENGEIEYDIIPSYFKHLYDNGIRTIFVNGGCGEFSSLTVNERKKVLEKWNEVVEDDVQILVNIGTCNVSDTIELGNHALSLSRLYGVAIVPPFYMPINNEENLVDYLIYIARALVRDIPILYYHIPSVSKVEIDIKKFLNLVKKREFHQLAAVKCTESNFTSFLDFLEGVKCNNLHINIYCGYEPLLMEAIKAGGKGAILGFASVFPQLINSIITRKISEDDKSGDKILKDLFNDIVEFSALNKVNIVGLLKITAEFYSLVKLGPMKKPYTLSPDIVLKFQKMLSEKNISFTN